MDITAEERLNLKKLINETECDDNTEYIRKIKHSTRIRDGIRCLEQLKITQSELRQSDPEKFLNMAQTSCEFLYNSYTDIFNKAMKDEIDLGIMTKLLTILKMIEDEKVDQHEGSVLVCRILKELYLDSAVKRADNLDKEHESEKVERVEGKTISWRDYKKTI